MRFAHVSQELSLYASRQLTEADLVPFDREQAAWCEAAVEEFQQLTDFDIEELRRDAPHLYRQLKSDAEDDNETPEEHIAAYDGGLRGYLSELIRWTRQELETARKRPEVLQLADQFRARNLVLSAHTVQLFTRYQTMLDNHLYKALRALREAQEWRLKQSASTEPADLSDVTDAS